MTGARTSFNENVISHPITVPSQRSCGGAWPRIQYVSAQFKTYVWSRCNDGWSLQTFFLQVSNGMASQISSTFICNDVERSKLLQLGKGANISISRKIIHEAFDDIARQHPSVVAIEYGAEQITYGELKRKADRLSRRLLHLGLQPRSRVVLLLRRCIPMVIAILAVLKCGCQYVPLDGGVVSDVSLSHILSETEARFILCLNQYSERARRFATQVVELIALEEVLQSLDQHQGDTGARALVDPNDSAYTIYTSGKSSFTAFDADENETDDLKVVLGHQKV